MNYKKLTVLPLFAMFMAASTLAVHAADKWNSDNAGQLSSSDYKLARTAATAGMAEVQAGNIAASNSRNNAVQQFGLRMVQDHSQANNKLAALLASKGATMPSQLTSHQQREIDRLSKYSGQEFDKEYASGAVKDHKDAVKLFKKGSEDAKDAQLRDWFASTLPTIQEHLRMSEELDHTVRNDLSMNK